MTAAPRFPHGGSDSLLGDDLAGADIAVMDGAAEAASVIGDACAARGIMTAGLVVAGNRDLGGVVSALRPHALALVVPAMRTPFQKCLPHCGPEIPACTRM